MDDEDKERFQIELEFVQALANPLYLRHLATERYLEDAAFLEYLRYLRYWQRPEYVQFIAYPHCLQMLELLQHKAFREQLSSPEAIDFIHTQQFYHWQFYRNARMLRDEATAAPTARIDT